MRILAMCLAGVLAGCVGPDRIVETASGRPEAMFVDTTPTEVANTIASGCADVGAFITEKTPGSVICTREMTGNDDFMVQMFFGNAYSSTPTLNSRFTLIDTGDAVRVLLYQWIETDIAYGQTKKLELDSDLVFNEGMDFLRFIGGR